MCVCVCARVCVCGTYNASQALVNFCYNERERERVHKLKRKRDYVTESIIRIAHVVWLATVTMQDHFQ